MAQVAAKGNCFNWQESINFVTFETTYTLTKLNVTYDNCPQDADHKWVSDSGDYNELYSAYTDALSNQGTGQDMTIDADQLDLMLSTAMVLVMCVCFCLGWLAHENGAK